MLSQYMDELEQDPFQLADFIERLTWRTNNEACTTTAVVAANTSTSATAGSSAVDQHFDADLLHETFTQTIRDLRQLQERQQRKCERLERLAADEQALLTARIEELQSRHQHTVDGFDRLDWKLNSLGGKIFPLGEQLENVNTPRSRIVEAQGLLQHMTEFLQPGPVVNDMFADRSRLFEAADCIQKLYTIAQDLPADKFGDARRKIEAKYDEIERALIEQFADAQKLENVELMRRLATMLAQFKGYGQCIDAYIELSQQSAYGEKDVYAGILPMCRHHHGIIQRVFAAPEQVMAKFVLNIYQLKLYKYAETLLADRKDNEKYLRTLFELYSRTAALSAALAAEFASEDDELLRRLTGNIFARYLVTYVDTEVAHLEARSADELRRFYEAKRHQKRPAERFQELRRDMKALIAAKANISIAQAEDYGGETFLSEELAINLLQEWRVALRRCRLLSRPDERPANVVRLTDLLLRYLMHEHVDYALELGLHAIPLGESRTVPQLHFFEVVQKCNTVVLLLEKLYAASVEPAVRGTERSADCAAKKRIQLEQIESRLDLGLERSVTAIVNWVRVSLAAEQRKTDFCPLTDDLDTVASPACLDVVRQLQPIIAQMQRCMDGANLAAVLAELGQRIHRTIYEHLQQYQFNTAGAMFAICDVKEYRRCLATPAAGPLVAQLFDVLHALCNLLLVKHENLQEVCGGETLVSLRWRRGRFLAAKLFGVYVFLFLFTDYA